jgi:ABC-type antimicrobial peptide transport system permease subunit
MTGWTRRPSSRRTLPLRYNLRSLRARWVTTALTMGSVALVVATFVAVMALANGLTHAIGDGADPANAILLYKGGISEAMSRVTMDQFKLLRLLPQIRPGERGVPLASLESIVQINRTLKKGGQTMVVLRGMRDEGRGVRPLVRLTAGRWPNASGECVVGRRVAQRFVGMATGESFEVGHWRFAIVGVLAAGGTGSEAEIWARLDDVVAAAHRDWYNSVTVRLRDPPLLAAFGAEVKRDPRIDLSVRSEASYLAEQAGDAEGFRQVGLVVCFFMAIGACFAEMNTMYAAIGSRTREIGTLRALGFARTAILVCFLGESMLLAIPGGIAGCLAGTAMNGCSMTVLSFASVSEVSFELAVTPGILAGAFAFSLALGILGGLVPAIHASRIPILDALRKV